MITAIVERIVQKLDVVTRGEHPEIEEFEVVPMHRASDDLSAYTDYHPDRLEDTERALTEFARATL